jgi:VWFA-related protein
MIPGFRRLIVVSVLAALATPAWAQDEPVAVFKSSVDLVSMAAIVRDGKGKIVPSLRREDFEILDSGKARPILDLRTELAAPASVALLVDGSGSMKVGAANDLSQRISSAILASLNPSRDDAALYSFDTRLLSVQEFTHDLKRVNERLGVVDAWGSTSLYDAIAGTAAIVSKRTANRRALVVLTDGADTASAYTPEQVSAIASSVDVPVYVFVMATATKETDKEAFDAERRNVQVRTRKKGLSVRTRGWYLSGAAE